MSAEGEALAAAAREQAVKIAATHARVDARLARVNPAASAAFRANWAPLLDALAARHGREPLPAEPTPPRGN